MEDDEKEVKLVFSDEDFQFIRDDLNNRYKKTDYVITKIKPDNVDHLIDKNRMRTVIIEKINKKLGDKFKDDLTVSLDR